MSGNERMLRARRMLIDWHLAECAVRRLIDEMRDIALRGVPEEVTDDAD